MLNISQTAVRPLDRHCALILQSYTLLLSCSSAHHLPNQPATVQVSIRMEREADLTDGAWWCQTCWSSLLTQPSEISLSVICENVLCRKKVLLMEPFTPTAYFHRMNYILVLFFFRPNSIFFGGGSFSSAAFCESDELRIPISSFSCLKTSGPPYCFHRCAFPILLCLALP